MDKKLEVASKLVMAARKRWPDIRYIVTVHGDTIRMPVDVVPGTKQFRYKIIRLESFKDNDESIGKAGYLPESKTLVICLNEQKEDETNTS